MIAEVDLHPVQVFIPVPRRAETSWEGESLAR